MTLRSEHPRVLLSPAILARLRASKDAGSQRWLALVQVCEAYLGNTSPYQAGVLNFALAYAVTGDARYGDKAVALADLYYVSKGMDAIHARSSKSGLAADQVLLEVSLCYDWCYNRIAYPTQRDRFRAQMQEWCDWIWPETNPEREGAWGTDRPGDNFFHRFMLSTWLAGLALGPESAKAKGYLDHALWRWREEVRPYLNREAAGGYLAEGTHYGTGTMARIWVYLLAHLTATGEDLIGEPGFVWPGNSITARIHLTTPDMDHLAPLGDQPVTVDGRINDQARMGMLAALSYGPRIQAPDIRFWLDNITPSMNQDRLNRWMEFLWYREDIPARDDRHRFVTGYHTSGPGIMVARSDWGPDAAMLVAQCGPLREAHQDRAANGWMLWAGNDWLVTTARACGFGGLQREAQHNNALTVAGRVQPEGRGYLPEPKVLHFEDTAEVAHFAGEAAGAYTYRGAGSQPTPVLREWRREWLWLKPRWLILLDRVEKVNPADAVTWHLNVRNEPEVEDGTFTVAVPGAKMFGSRLIGGPWFNVVPVNGGRDGAQSSWRVEMPVFGGSSTDLLLHVVEIAPEEQEEPTPVSFTPPGATLSVLQFGGHRVEIEFTSTGPTMMTLLPPEPPLPPDPEPVTVRARSVHVTGGDGETLVVTYMPEVL